MNLQWKFIAKSVIGHSHIRKNLPNQDAGKVQRNSSGYPLIAAIADGHGGKNYFRSDRGSGFAVHSAVNVIANYFQEDPSLSRPKVAESICKDILKGWKVKVIEDIRENPYNSEELTIIEEGKAARKLNIPMDDEYDLIRPYGSTILAAIVTEKFVSFFQLGDGDIVVHTEGELFSRPIPSDKNLAGNETYSLCMPESWRDFKVERIDEIPDYIMLCTDGYANSFLDDSGFLTAARDIYSYIYKAESFESGVDLIKSNLGGWLSQASEKGSGDDITTIILARDPDKSKRRPPKFSDDDVVVLNPVSLKPASYGFLQLEKKEEIIPRVVPKKNVTPQPKAHISELKEETEDKKSPISSHKKPAISQIRTERKSDIPPPKGKIRVSKKIIFLIILILVIGIVAIIFMGSGPFQSPEKPIIQNPPDKIIEGGEEPGPSQDKFPSQPNANSTEKSTEESGGLDNSTDENERQTVTNTPTITIIPAIQSNDNNIGESVIVTPFPTIINNH